MTKALDLERDRHRWAPLIAATALLAAMAMLVGCYYPHYHGGHHGGGYYAYDGDGHHDRNDRSDRGHGRRDRRGHDH